MAIDVLAVMDADIARRQQTAAALSEQARPICERLNFSRIEEMRQARAAVADLIEAASKIKGVKQGESLLVSFDDIADLAVALARIGGAL